MQSVIMHPDGIAAGIDSPDARRQIDVTSSDVEQVVGRSRNLTSIERLHIYGNAYYARLLECLREEFPALLHAVGPEAFDALAFAYLQDCPSKSYTLANLAAQFPEHLAKTRPPREAPVAGPDWPDFLIDLATLERTYSEVFDGPGVEGMELLSTDDLLAVSPERWEEVRLVTVECLRLLEFRFPVHEYATAVKQGGTPAIPDARPTMLAISRRDYVVRRWELEPLEFALLKSIQQGASLGESIGLVADEVDDAALDGFGAQLRRWFEKWATGGFFAAIRGN